MFDSVINYVFMFFFFSAVGWTCECTYRSLGERRVINSGFLHGPICPIYGTGGLVFHFFLVPISQPIEKKFWLVLLLGMVLADTVEYITSYLMEKLFHARWWDYSNNFLNIHGRICFKHTMYWMIFSFLYVYVIAPVYGFINGFIPQTVRTYATFVILAIFLADLALTVKDAVNIQKVMTKLESLKASVTGVSDTIKAAAENLKDSAEYKYSELYDLIASGDEKFDDWSTKTNTQYSEVKTELENLKSGKRTKSSSKGTKRLIMNTELYKTATKRLSEIERIWEELKARYKDDIM